MTTSDRTPADLDPTNSTHTMSRPCTPRARGAQRRPVLRRGLGPAVGLAVSAGLTFAGPALAAGSTAGPSAQSSPQQASQQQTAADRAYSSPVPGGTGEPTSEFASPDRPQHAGTDFAVPTGTPVTSVTEGTVLRTATSDEGGALKHHTGKGVVIDHGEINGDRMYSYYGHLDDVQVEPGDTVEAGTRIGKSGNTGDSTGPHLHLGVFMNSEDPDGAIWNAESGVGFIDPVAWLDRKGIDAGQDAPIDP